MKPRLKKSLHTPTLATARELAAALPEHLQTMPAGGIEEYRAYFSEVSRYVDAAVAAGVVSDSTSATDVVRELRTDPVTKLKQLIGWSPTKGKP